MKKESKNRGFVALYIVVTVVLGLLVFVSVANITGNSFLQTLFGTSTESAGATLYIDDGSMPTFGNQTNCTDSDGGKYYFRFGVTKNPKTTFSDYCVIENQLKEGYCDTNGEVKAELYKCPSGYICQGGACKINQSNQSQNQTRNQTGIQGVTYQGVLDMLNSCTPQGTGVITNSTAGFNCNSYCGAYGKICIFSLLQKYYSKDVEMLETSCIIPPQELQPRLPAVVYCQCCKVPSKYAEADDIMEGCYGRCQKYGYSPEICREVCSNEAIA